MIKQITIEPEAENDLTTSYDWYEERRIGLGKEFLSAFESVVEQLTRFPESGPIANYKDYRRILLKKFPFEVIYFIKNSNIFILAVFHVKMSDEKKQSRMN